MTSNAPARAVTYGIAGELRATDSTTRRRDAPAGDTSPYAVSNGFHPATRRHGHPICIPVSGKHGPSSRPR
ncbi:hypothetical protein ACIBSV_42475 [Embleya sp. NPDC050154]|uniref:hypothetical protein n=1 Tax=Embleya sp. NPDC050154 TaxID=3363988 RepID=UPI0037A79853